MAKATAEVDIRILFVDDDEDDFALTRDLLCDIPDSRYRFDWISDYEQAIDAICDGDYDAVLLDYKLGARTGLDLLKAARTRGCFAPVILLTGLSAPEIDLEAMQLGAVDYLEKSRLDATLLERTIRYAIRQKKIETELERRVCERTAELDRVNETLRQTDRRKDEFIATLAHELRNPLAPIRNALEILRLSGDKPDTITSIRGILERQVAQLIRLIDDLLDVSRISRGKLRLSLERISIQEVIEAAVEQSRPPLEAAQQMLTIDLPADPVFLTGDRIRLAQVFTNLLNNSAKYSEPGGGVFISAARHGAEVTVTVRDSGVGIAAEALPLLFQPFAQIDRTLSKAQGGLGIGLAIVHQLVELHGGTVAARSEGHSHGAEFIVSLPCETG